MSDPRQEQSCVDLSDGSVRSAVRPLGGVPGSQVTAPRVLNR